MVDYEDYQISKSNRRGTQGREYDRRDIGRMGQPPTAASGSVSRKDRDRKHNQSIRRAKKG